MERQSPRRKKKKRRTRTWKETPGSPPQNAHHLFAQMLAAYSNIQTPFSQSLILKCLREVHLSFIQPHDSTVHELLPDALLSLLPLLLTTKYPKIAACSGEIVGAVALFSFETNVSIASNKETVNALVTALGSCSKQVVVAACNGLLDLSSTSVGREQLQESSAIDKLLSVFCQITTSPTKSVSHCDVEKGSGKYIEDKLVELVLEAVSVLINNCSKEHLERIPGELSVTSVFYLKERWAKMQCKGGHSNQERSYTCSNIQMHDLAETIFRLSMNYGPCTTCTSVAVQRSMFGGMESDFENFMLSYWENSPLLIRRASQTLDAKDDIFSVLIRSFNSQTIDAILVSILGRLVCCPPISSDELDILNFLKDVKGGLGCPIRYGQDIRVVKTAEFVSMPEQSHLRKELHMLKDGVDFGAVKSLEFADTDYVQTCKEAYHNSYTIALRGMEFRSENVCAIADGLETLFGQPSVGANFYLTPPKSQGLARHSDDHCVFVCQLLGKKQWAVFPRSTVQLPRLYEPVNSLLGSEDGSDAREGKQFLLSEGDILYIPRGCPHEACTVHEDGNTQIDEMTGFSLHLTLGIEVEPPFEWEGFAHVALHCWNQNRNKKAHDPVNSTSRIPNVMIVNLLHIAIRLIGDHNPIFRKACMVAAFSFPDSGSEPRFHALDLNQKATFSCIINRINTDSCFLEAFRTVQAAFNGKNDDTLLWMRWLRHLPQEATDEKTDFNNPLESLKDLVLLHTGCIEEAAASFEHVKTQFCMGIVFEDVCKSFEMLLKKYRKTRKQYMNGMLSLHCIK